MFFARIGQIFTKSVKQKARIPPRTGAETTQPRLRVINSSLKSVKNPGLKIIDFGRGV